MIILGKLCYVKENEFLEIVNKKVKNAQDRFLMALVYYSKTDKMQDLVGIKTSDIDFDSNIIHTKGGKVKMNNVLRKMAKEALEQETYERITLAGMPTDTYKLNMSSEYVIKTKPLKSTNDGLNPLSYSSLRYRFLALKDSMGLKKLSINSLVSSKIIDDMLKIKHRWTTMEIEEYFKENNITRSYYRFYKLINELKEIWQEVQNS